MSACFLCSFPFAEFVDAVRAPLNLRPPNGIIIIIIDEKGCGKKRRNNNILAISCMQEKWGKCVSGTVARLLGGSGSAPFGTCSMFMFTVYMCSRCSWLIVSETVRTQHSFGSAGNLQHLISWLDGPWFCFSQNLMRALPAGWLDGWDAILGTGSAAAHNATARKSRCSSCAKLELPTTAPVRSINTTQAGVYFLPSNTRRHTVIICF